MAGSGENRGRNRAGVLERHSRDVPGVHARGTKGAGLEGIDDSYRHGRRVARVEGRGYNGGPLPIRGDVDVRAGYLAGPGPARRLVQTGMAGRGSLRIARIPRGADALAYSRGPRRAECV